MITATPELVEDYLLQGEGLCRESRILGGNEFMCYLPVHDEDEEHSPSPTAPLMTGWWQHRPADRHMMVRRYPDPPPETPASRTETVT